MCACLHTAVVFACIWTLCVLHTEQLVSHWILQINGCWSMDGWVLCNDHLIQALYPFCQASRKGGHVHKFPLTPPCFPFSEHTFLSQCRFTLHFLSHTHAHINAHAHIHTWDKPMNSARGGVLDQGGTCFTTMRDRLTKTTETAKRKGEKRIW